jgi:excinuclease UvrABC nuclease subunit
MENLDHILLNDNENWDEYYESKCVELPFKVYCGVYFLYDNNELVYIGVSQDIAVRLASHRHTKEFNQVKIIEEQDHLKALKIESYFIYKYKPKYNKFIGLFNYGKLHAFTSKKKFDESKYQNGWKKSLSTYK